MRSVASAACLALCALATATTSDAKPAPSPTLQLAASALGADVRDLRLLASAFPAAREQASGSAVIVQVDDGRDGGVPGCWLMELSGRPTAPGSITSQTRLSICPAGAETKQTKLYRVQLSLKLDAWLSFTANQRVDSYAKGMSKSGLWALVGKSDPSGETRLLFERTSTSFQSKADPSANSMEACQQPKIAADGVEPTTLTLQCTTETTLGKQVKRGAMTASYTWNGEGYR